MSLRASPTAIGLFLLGALAIAIIGTAVLASATWFQDRTSFVSYFPESVNGLENGAPVKFQGVPVGRVTAINIEIDQRDDRRRDLFGEVQLSCEVERHRQRLTERSLHPGRRAKERAPRLRRARVVIGDEPRCSGENGLGRAEDRRHLAGTPELLQPSDAAPADRARRERASVNERDDGRRAVHHVMRLGQHVARDHQIDEVCRALEDDAGAHAEVREPEGERSVCVVHGQLVDELRYLEEHGAVSSLGKQHGYAEQVVVRELRDAARGLDVTSVEEGVPVAVRVRPATREQVGVEDRTRMDASAAHGASPVQLSDRLPRMPGREGGRQRRITRGRERNAMPCARAPVDRLRRRADGATRDVAGALVGDEVVELGGGSSEPCLAFGHGCAVTRGLELLRACAHRRWTSGRALCERGRDQRARSGLVERRRRLGERSRPELSPARATREIQRS